MRGERFCSRKDYVMQTKTIQIRNAAEKFEWLIRNHHLMIWICQFVRTTSMEKSEDMRIKCTNRIFICFFFISFIQLKMIWLIVSFLVGVTFVSTIASNETVKNGIISFGHNMSKSNSNLCACFFFFFSIYCVLSDIFILFSTAGRLFIAPPMIWRYFRYVML